MTATIPSSTSIVYRLSSTRLIRVGDCPVLTTCARPMRTSCVKKIDRHFWRAMAFTLLSNLEKLRARHESPTAGNALRHRRRHPPLARLVELARRTRRVDDLRALQVRQRRSEQHPADPEATARVSGPHVVQDRRRARAVDDP